MSDEIETFSGDIYRAIYSTIQSQFPSSCQYYDAEFKGNSATFPLKQGVRTFKWDRTKFTLSSVELVNLREVSTSDKESPVSNSS